MNIVESLATLVATLTGTTLGQDMFVGHAPSSNKVTDPIWWVVGRGGAVVSTNPTAERTKERIIEVYCRDRDYRAIYNAMQDLEEQLNCVNCVTLEGYEVLDVTATPLFVDEDLDLEDRKLGSLQVNIIVYQTC